MGLPSWDISFLLPPLPRFEKREMSQGTGHSLRFVPSPSNPLLQDPGEQELERGTYEPHPHSLLGTCAHWASLLFEHLDTLAVTKEG